jgi:hypothetical protein
MKSLLVMISILSIQQAHSLNLAPPKKSIEDYKQSSKVFNKKQPAYKRYYKGDLDPNKNAIRRSPMHNFIQANGLINQRKLKTAVEMLEAN